MPAGRVKKFIDETKLKELMRYRPTLSDCAAWFNCSEDTIERRIKELEHLNFAEFRAKYLGRTKLTLIQRAMSMALEGDKVMLKFCLKNLAGWSEDPSIHLEGNASNPSFYRIIVDKDEESL